MNLEKITKALKRADNYISRLDVYAVLRVILGGMILSLLGFVIVLMIIDFFA